MVRRINPFALESDTLDALIVFGTSASLSRHDPNLVTLVQLRVSQIFGSEFCIDRYARDARVAGETDERLANLEIWSTNSLFSPREKAALAWAETVARADRTQVPDAAYAVASQYFCSNELVALTAAVAAATAWNLIAVSFRMPASPCSWTDGPVEA